MFIHLGEDVVIRAKDVVAILDSQLLDSASIVQEFILEKKAENAIVEITEGYVKSIVITTDKVYFSPLSSLTLKRRSQLISELDSHPLY